MSIINIRYEYNMKYRGLVKWYKSFKKSCKNEHEGNIIIGHD